MRSAKSSHENLASEVWDFIIIGSGFGGSVCAMRLTQKGYKVLLLEKGKRFKKEDFPKTNWNFKKFFWFPLLKCFGIQQITLLKDVMVLHGSGLGGGSLVYANTLMKPSNEVLASPDWNLPTEMLNRFKLNYDIAKKMLGVVKNQVPKAADEELKQLARKFGKEETFQLTEVGVNFHPSSGCDPYFGGDGPKRDPCTSCGGCMVGCRFGAKNTLDLNYLYFAEKWGAKIRTESHVLSITPISDANTGAVNHKVCVAKPGQMFSEKKDFLAKKVIISCGVIGTLKLLFANKYRYKTLPHISDELGNKVRTNGESLCGATTTSTELHKNFSEGISIGSAFHPNEFTKIEPVRYPVGSNAMKLLALPLADEVRLKLTHRGGAFSDAIERTLKLPSIAWLLRVLNFVIKLVLKAPSYLKTHWKNDWARNTIILLVMQSTDEMMKVRFKRRWTTLFRRTITNENSNVPSYIPVAQRASKILAEQIQGLPQNIISEVLFRIPATAHILGGAPIGSDARNSAISTNFELHNHPGIYVCDGSNIQVNLGVNPSLTITALAETFCEQFPAIQEQQKMTFGPER